MAELFGGEGMEILIIAIPIIVVIVIIIWALRKNSSMEDYAEAYEGHLDDEDEIEEIEDFEEALSKFAPPETREELEDLEEEIKEARELEEKLHSGEIEQDKKKAVIKKIQKIDKKVEKFIFSERLQMFRPSYVRVVEVFSVWGVGKAQRNAAMQLLEQELKGFGLLREAGNETGITLVDGNEKSPGMKRKIENILNKNLFKKTLGKRLDLIQAYNGIEELNEKEYNCLILTGRKYKYWPSFAVAGAQVEGGSRLANIVFQRVIGKKQILHEFTHLLGAPIDEDKVKGKYGNCTHKPCLMTYDLSGNRICGHCQKAVHMRWSDEYIDWAKDEYKQILKAEKKE